MFASLEKKYFHTISARARDIKTFKPLNINQKRDFEAVVGGGGDFSKDLQKQLIRQVLRSVAALF